MKIIRDLFLVCLISSLCAGFSKRKEIYDPLGIYKTDFVQPRPSEQKNKCFCPPVSKDDVQLFEALGKSGTELDRLVVYFYKDKNNQDVIAYTPNKEKQMSIPDLMYTTSDGVLRVGTETVVAMFESNPNVITVPVTVPLEYAVPDTLGINVGNIDDVYPHVLKPQLPYRNLNIPYNHYKQIKHPFQLSGIFGYENGPQSYFNSFDLNNLLNGTQTTHHQPALHVHVSDTTSGKTNSALNNWFDGQLAQLTYADAIDTSHLDVNHLKHQIIQLFHENNLTYDGVHYVTDVNGKYVNMNNIKLHPVVSGHEPLNYKGMLPLSNLNGIIVTTVNPSKVLGIVPISELSQTVDAASSRPDLTINKEPVQSKGDIFRLIEIIKFIINVLGQYYDPNVVDELRKRLDNVGKAKSIVFSKPSGKEKDVELPWYRIIGGSAALNSGAPLNSKGRAADVMDILTNLFG